MAFLQAVVDVLTLWFKSLIIADEVSLGKVRCTFLLLTSSSPTNNLPNMVKPEGTTIPSNMRSSVHHNIHHRPPRQGNGYGQASCDLQLFNIDIKDTPKVCLICK